MRRETREITLGNVKIGGNAPISVQSMTKTDTQDIPATVKQIKELEMAGCDIVRLAVPDMDAAKSLGDIKISVKSTDVMTMIEAYRIIAEKTDYPLHLGVTEAGTMKMGTIKSAIGIGTLLADGIGDTIRVSLTGDPVEEVHVGIDILRSLGIRQKGVEI